MLDALPSPRTLLVGVLLVAGILLLVWSIVQLLHRNLSAGLIQGSHVLLTEPPLSGDISEAGDEQKISSNLLDYGPPKLSLELQARETSVDPTALPLLAANDDALGVQDCSTTSQTNSEAVEEMPLALRFILNCNAKRRELQWNRRPFPKPPATRFGGSFAGRRESSALAIDSKCRWPLPKPLGR